MALPDLGTTHSLKELQHPQDNPDVTVNDMRDQLGAVAGLARLVKNLTADADYTLDTAAGSREDLYGPVKITDTGTVLTTGRNVIVPTRVQVRFIENATAQTLTVKTAAGTGEALTAGQKGWLLCDGTNVVKLVSDW
jgi:hypothetical protein